MKEKLLTQQVNFEFEKGIVKEIQLPNKCPHCRRLTNFHYKAINYNKYTERIESWILCGYTNCGGYIIGYHDRNGLLVNTEPPLFEQITLPEFANKVSSNFVSIYKEAVEAKSRGLHQIAGPGFRKSCEFLIKDYAKSLIEEIDEKEKVKKEQKIEKTAVGSIVKDFISDVRVQKVAQRAFWIGNDETHYIRKWTDKNIEDLIILIKLTLDWIEIERLSSEYEDEMPE